MPEPLEASVTLDEIFTVVASKRVPLAPELAGYLALEIAETPAAREGNIDPKSVYVGDEGTVALVRTKKEEGGDPEASIRALLARLLEVGGSQTPALGAAAKKKSGTGLEALVEELEAALIPVNRGAGRRALARLAREVKRVTLNVGRNAMRSGSSEIAPVSDRSPLPAEKPIEKPIEKAIEKPVEAAKVPEKPISVLPPPNPPPPKSNRPPPAAPAFETEESTTSHQLQKPPSMSELPTIGLTKEDIERAQGRNPRDSVDSLLDKFEVSERREDKALSKDLKAIAGLEPTPPPAAATFDEVPSDDEGLDALLGATSQRAPRTSSSDRPPTRPDAPASRRSRPSLRHEPPTSESKVQIAQTPPPQPRPRTPSMADDRVLPTGPASLPRMPSVSDLKRKRPNRFLFPIVAVLILGSLAAAIMWQLKPGFFTGRTPEAIEKERQDAERREKERQAALANNVTCRTAIMISGAPDNAEILVRAGTAPVDIDRMPVGPRLELVATLDGYAPQRAVIEKDAQWEKGADGKPRLEVGVSLAKSTKKVDPWPPAEPGSEAGGKGDLGVVHVVATPKGAEVWVLVGLGPDARVDDFVKCDADGELLVAGPKDFRKRLPVKAADFAPDPNEKGNVRVAKVTVPKK